MIRTSSILFWFSLVIIASLGLYRTSNRVQELDQQLRATNAAIDAEKQSLHVLKAEWVYLSNPARIEAAARRHLALRPTAPAQVATLDTLSEVVPTRAEAMATMAVNATPMANVKTTLAARVAPQPLAVAHAVRAAKAKPTVLAAKQPETEQKTAANESGYVRDHMIMVQHTASAAPLPGDRIGALITELDTGR